MRRIRKVTVESSKAWSDADIYEISADAEFAIDCTIDYMEVRIKGPTENLVLKSVVSIALGPVQEVPE